MVEFNIPIKLWTTGNWTSELNVVSELGFTNTGDNVWGRLRWQEDGTSNEDKAYVRVSILDTNNVVLRQDIQGSPVIGNTRFNRSINVDEIPHAKNVNIRVRFKLHALDRQPVVSNVELLPKNKW